MHFSGLPSVTPMSPLLAVTEKPITHSPDFDQPTLPSHILEPLLQVLNLHALAGYNRVEESYGVSCYPLYPRDSNDWSIELYDISRPIDAQYHKLQTKLLFVVEGTTTIQVDAQEKTLQPGHSVKIYPESTYSLTPSDSGCRFLSVSFFAGANDAAGNVDVFSDKSLPKSMPQCEVQETSNTIFVDEELLSSKSNNTLPSQLSEMNKKNFREICLNGANTACDLIDGKSVEDRYNVSILDIMCGRKHFHDFETERRIVLGGNLEVEIDKNVYSLSKGQMCRISPTVVHRFKSQDSTSVTRLFAINYPAYNPNNVRLAE